MNFQKNIFSITKLCVSFCHISINSQTKFRVFCGHKKTPVNFFAGVFVFCGDFINLRLSCFLRKLSRVLFERQLELERILRIPL